MPIYTGRGAGRERERSGDFRRGVRLRVVVKDERLGLGPGCLAAGATAPGLTGPLAPLGSADVSASYGPDAGEVPWFLGSLAGRVVSVLALGF